MPEKRDIRNIKTWLDDVYQRYHRREYIGSDPVQYVHRYSNPGDQEIVGLIASSLAYGNVTAINTSIERVLERMDYQPHSFISHARREEMKRAFSSFKHRWTDGCSMVALLTGMQNVIGSHGSLGAAFVALDDASQPITKTLSRWVNLVQPEKRSCHYRPLLADTERKSACKRLHLYLRWMVRKDVVDPGCWTGVSPARLYMPLDVHVFRFTRACGFTSRVSADGRTVEEITSVFKKICPEDPVKYDFSLTRPGIIDGWNPRSTPWNRSGACDSKPVAGKKVTKNSLYS